MRRADFIASIKKIEICNKVKVESWGQTIRLTLGDIELTNENLVELRQFRANEPVKVVIEAEQVSLSDIKTKATTEHFIELEENQPNPPPSAVVKVFKF
ncbi:hypothetical protein V6C27_02085 [Peptococcaceae bacterium 1198_IL3148]